MVDMEMKKRKFPKKELKLILAETEVPVGANAVCNACAVVYKSFRMGLTDRFSLLMGNRVRGEVVSLEEQCVTGKTIKYHVYTF